MAMNESIKSLIDSNRKLSDRDVDNLFYYFYWRQANNEEKKYWSTKASWDLYKALEPNAKQFKTAWYYKDVIWTDVQPTGSESRVYIANEQKLQEIRSQLAARWIPQSEWSKYITKDNDWRLYYQEPTSKWFWTWAMSWSQTDALNVLYSEIDSNPDYSDAEKSVLKYAISQDYWSWEKIWSKEELWRVLDDAVKNVETDISPYYEKVKYRDLEDLKTAMQDLRSESSRYVQQEAKSYKDLLEKTKKSIRERWWMLSWESRAELWKEWALWWKWVEWNLPTQRRYDWEDKSTEMVNKARDLWTAAERMYWSAVVSDVQKDFWWIADPYGYFQNRFWEWNIDYHSWNYRPSYLARQVWQEWYVRSWSDKAEWAMKWTYLWDYWLNRAKDLEQAKWKNVERYWL